MNPPPLNPGQNPPPDVPPPLPIAIGHQAPFRTLLAWVVIIGSVALMVGVTVVRKQQPNPSDGPTAQHLFTFRYAIGAEQMLGSLAASQPSNSIGRQLATQARDGARNDTDRLYAGLLTFAIDSRERGLRTVTALAESPDAAVRDEATLLLPLLQSESPRASDADRAAVVDRHKWIGRYVLSLTAADPAADLAELQGEARRTFLVIITFGVLIIILLTAGLVLLVLGCVFLATGTLRLASTLGNGGDVAHLEGFALYLGLMSLGITWGVLDLPGDRFIGLPLALVGFGLGIAWPFIGRRAGTPARAVRDALGLHAGAGVMKEVLFGAIGYIALLPLTVLGIFVTVVLTRLTGADATHPVGNELGGPLIMFLLLGFLAAVFAPVTEELMFRGALFGHVRTRLHWVVSAAIVALIFAAIHPQGWAGIPVIATIGFNMALIRQWRGSIIAPIIGHAMNNGAIVLLMGLAIR